MKIDSQNHSYLKEFLQRHGRGNILILTGAGISAASGIPTFRGPEGYWTVGSKVFKPQEAATWAMFSRHPKEIWEWYLYRRSVCAAAEPNPAHHALVALERALGDRFSLVTQNVDGLHLRAGQSPERTFQIHGNVHRMRCVNECGAPVMPIPSSIGPFKKEDKMDEAMWELLHCPECRGLMRPHVLWFDEYYNEDYFFLDSARARAGAAGLLIVAGTSGATTLPLRLLQACLQRGGALLDVNPDDNPFSEAAERIKNGLFCQGPATVFLPAIVEMLKGEKQ